LPSRQSLGFPRWLYWSALWVSQTDSCHPERTVWGCKSVPERRRIDRS
jgi:hypothetical protein